MYCGNDVIVKKAIASKAEVSISHLVNLMETSFKGRNYQESYTYANKTLELDPNNIDAWLTKGLSALALTSYNKPRVNEALECFKKIKLISLDRFNTMWPTLSKGIVETYFFLYKKAGEFQNWEYQRQCLIQAFHFDSDLIFAEFYLQYLIDNPDLVVYNTFHEIFSDNDIKKISKSILQRKPDFKVIIVESWADKLEYVALGYECVVVISSDNREKWIQFLTSFNIPYEVKEVKKGGMCFVATATYGTSFVHEVEFLQYWRDEYLLKNSLGNLFVEIYYKISPAIADWISKSEKRRALVRSILDRFIKFLRKRI